MVLSSLTALSPIDGRYFSATEPLVPYFSEYALIRYRLLVEVEYFISLCELPLPELKKFPKTAYTKLRSLYKKPTKKEATLIKQIEASINHDVKAVEYYIKQKFDAWGLGDYKEFIHFGLTSQDINNTAIPLLVKDFMEEALHPTIHSLINLLSAQVKKWKDVPMLGRTHGQPASPTRLGKEIQVFVTRVKNQLALLQHIPHTAKFGGATGNFNAHHVAYPTIDWHVYGDRFITQLRLTRSFPTTQIEHYDNLAALFDAMKRINTILIDYARDMWQYVAMDYFTQHIAANEVGSSAMPHKVNPIDFENAEGNLGLSNALFEYLAAKLPISRLQRDLTDSTTLRNIGTPFAHLYIALQSLEKGIKKLYLNPSAFTKELNNNWAVIAEGIQTILRKEGYPRPYEALKGLTRKNQSITKKNIREFIESLKVKKEVKKQLLAITPFNYVGM